MCLHCISLSVMPVVLCACVELFYLPISVGANCQVSWGRGLGEKVGGGMHVEGFRVPCVCAGENRVVVVHLGCVGYGDTVTRLLTINA